MKVNPKQSTIFFWQYHVEYAVDNFENDEIALINSYSTHYTTKSEKSDKRFFFIFPTQNIVENESLMIVY